MRSLGATEAGSQGAREQPRSPPSPQRILLFLPGQQFHQSWAQGIQLLTQAAVREQVTWEPANALMLPPCVSRQGALVLKCTCAHTLRHACTSTHAHMSLVYTHMHIHTLTHTLVCIYTPPKYQVQAETAVPTGIKFPGSKRKATHFLSCETPLSKMSKKNSRCN